MSGGPGFSGGSFGGLPIGGGGGYAGASAAVWQAASAMAAAQERRRIEMEQKRLLRRARTDPKRLAVADDALQKGSLDLACLIYVRLAVSRPRTPITEQAKQRIANLQQEARKELAEVDAMLVEPTDRASKIKALVPVGSGEEWEGRVAKAFEEYDRLARKYESVPVVGGEIAKRVAKQRRRPAYNDVLNEVKAKRLLELGKQYEELGHQCCAYLVYEQALELVPAPSAQLVQERFAEMAANPQIVASAVSCREVQWCHEAFIRAEQMAPGRAEALFRQIVRRAPKDSKVYLAARDRVGPE